MCLVCLGQEVQDEYFAETDYCLVIVSQLVSLLGNQGYGSHNTGSAAETAKSYIPGTDANRESRYEQGRDTGSGNRGYGSSNQSYGSGETSACLPAFCFCQPMPLSLRWSADLLC